MTKLGKTRLYGKILIINNQSFATYQLCEKLLFKTLKTSKMETNKVTDALLGVAIGDALGVPYEFSSREKMSTNPATDMVGYGTHGQPAGTWSDDSSLTFCLADALCQGYDLRLIALKFIAWWDHYEWTAHNEVFDIGSTTSDAIVRLIQLIKTNHTEELSRQKLYGDEYDNGNGSLMRILPLLFYIKGKDLKKQFDIVWETSALTHRHIRAAMSCMIYLNFAEKLTEGKDKVVAYNETRKEISELWEEIDFDENERKHFKRLIQNDIRATLMDDLKTGGYVIEVLESSFWFFLNRNNYRDTVLSIINLGHDTDTSAAIVGGLAGIYYSADKIPVGWLASLARKDDIIELGNKLNAKYE